MLKSSFVKIIKSISRDELLLFKQFAESDYHNKNKNICNLLSYLINIHPEYSLQNMERGLIFKELFSNKTFSYVDLRLLFSQSLQLFDYFQSIELYKKKNLSQEINQLAYYSSKDFEVRFNKIKRKIKNSLDNKQIEDYQNQYQFHKLLYQQNISSNNYQTQNELQITSSYLDKFYIHQKLKDACELINRSLFLKKQYDLGILNHVVQYLQVSLSDFESELSIMIYYQIYLSLTDPKNNINYHRLKKKLSDHFDKFDKEEIRDMYFYLLNYATRKINDGFVEFNNEVFDIYKILLEKKLLIEENELAEIHYKNMITIGLRIKAYSFVEQFIHNFKNYLPANVKENAYNFNLANYYYESKNFDKAQRLLFNVSYSDIIYNLGAKSLLLRIYYDINEEVAFKSHVNAFKIYLTRNKLISNNKYRRYYLFLKIANTIFNIKLNIGFDSRKKTLEKIDKIKLKLKKEKTVTNITWLKKKIQEAEEQIV